MREVKALIGMETTGSRYWIIMSQKIRNSAPKNRFANKRSPWFCVLKTILVMFGTASPTNAMGPQNAVINPVRTAVIAIVEMRKDFRLIPKSKLAFSPNTKEFNGLIKKIQDKIPMK